LPLPGSRQGILARRLLKWHGNSQLDYPWRRTQDPFAVLLSEVMLRKTTRRQVRSVFSSFYKRFPNPEALDYASASGIEGEIRMLGMQKVRARGLKQLGRVIVRQHRGVVPNQKEQLMSLPLVGQYTANAVLCFAFGKELPLVDTNVARIVGRIFSHHSKKKRPQTDPKLWKFVGELIPKGKAREFNLAILDFGDSLCLASSPKCSLCPMLDICDYGNKFITFG